jgi:hypothetical protein
MRTPLGSTIGFVAATLFSALPAAAQNDGTITFAMHGEKGDKNDVFVQSYLGQKVRFESQDPSTGHSGAFIMDGATGTTTILMAERKMYMQFTPQDAANAATIIKPLADSLKKMGVGSSATVSTTTPQGTFHVSQTGSETVAGTPCTVYHVSGTDAKGKSGEGEVCVAQGAGLFMMGSGGGGPMAMFAQRMASNPATSAQYAAMKQILGPGKGILKVTKIDNGNKIVVIEATKIDRATPAKELFEAPKEYTKFDMPNMGAMMKQPGQMPNPGTMKPPSQ